jgi:tetratricopeptide (TPR) repeat protein
MKRLSAIVLLCCLLVAGCTTSRTAQSHIDKGLDDVAAKQLDRAVTEYSAAIDAKPEASVLAYALSLRAAAYTQLKQYDKALADANASIKLNDTDASAYLSRGYVYLALEKYDDAVKDFDKAISLDNKMALAFLGRATAHLQLGEADLALADYKSSIALDPNQPSASQINASIETLSKLLKK